MIPVVKANRKCYLNIQTFRVSVIIIIVYCSGPVKPQNVVVTAQGKLRGESNDGYVSYTGIPYAAVTENAGRFKKAGIAPFWIDIRESVLPHCTPLGIEECLRLEVHVPSSKSSHLPVLVWVTGGSGQYHPGRLVKEGIIVVIVYHRLGPLGFLCTKEDKIPGNAGAKDVVLALRWVRDNIVAFNGNPAKVILAGQSFGAAVVEALMLSPMTKGLYHGVILQSGTVLSPWAFNDDAEERASNLANLFNDDDVVPTLVHVKVADLVAKSNELDVPYFPFGMCVEQGFKNEECLLSKTPFDLLTNKIVNPVPMIIGYNSDEAYIFAANIKEAKVTGRISKELTFLLPEELMFLNERDVTQVARQIKEMYFISNVSMATLLAYHRDAYFIKKKYKMTADWITGILHSRDAYFINHIHRSTKLHASTSSLPVYYYQFSYSGNFGVDRVPGVQKTGAAHSDELAYLFPENGGDLEGEDGVVQKKLVQLWTNFVKYLNPTPPKGELIWEAVTPHDPRILSIDTELQMQEFPHKRAVQMWDDIYEKYYYSRQ